MTEVPARSKRSNTGSVKICRLLVSTALLYPAVGVSMRSYPTHGCGWPCSLDVGGRDERRTHPCRFHAVWSGRFLVKRKAHRRSFVLSFGLLCYELMRLEPPSHCWLFDQRYGCMSSPGRLWYVSKTHRRNFVSTSVLNWYLVTPRDILVSNVTLKPR